MKYAPPDGDVAGSLMACSRTGPTPAAAPSPERRLPPSSSRAAIVVPDLAQRIARFAGQHGV
jgi:hypothetical protein